MESLQGKARTVAAVEESPLLRHVGFLIGVIERCSPATTLIMNRLKFDGQQLAKRLDMIRQSSRHARCAVAPLGLDES
jgi:hypothetical protein